MFIYNIINAVINFTVVSCINETNAASFPAFYQIDWKSSGYSHVQSHTIVRPWHINYCVNLLKQLYETRTIVYTYLNQSLISKADMLTCPFENDQRVNEMCFDCEQRVEGRQREKPRWLDTSRRKGTPFHSLSNSPIPFFKAGPLHHCTRTARTPWKSQKTQPGREIQRYFFYPLFISFLQPDLS